MVMLKECKTERRPKQSATATTEKVKKHDHAKDGETMLKNVKITGEKKQADNCQRPSRM
jgi:hypothetical protein